MFSYTHPGGVVLLTHCVMLTKVERKVNDPELSKDVLDIEDLVALGKKKAFCPYYMTKELKMEADIIFMPYNYLLDPKTRKANGVDLVVSVMIYHACNICIIVILFYLHIICIFVQFAFNLMNSPHFHFHSPWTLITQFDNTCMFHYHFTAPFTLYLDSLHHVSFGIF